MSRRILFVILPEKGHIHPMIGPARVLMKRGHQVAFHCASDVSSELAKMGLSWHRVDGAATAPPRADNRGAAFADRARDPGALRRWIDELLLDGVPAQVPVVEQAIREFGPDVVVADPMAYQAPIAAMRAGLPWAALSSSLNPVLPDSLDSELLRTVRSLALKRDALFARFGCDARFRGCDCLSPHFTAVFSSEELVGAAHDDIELVGPSLPHGARGEDPAFPWERIDSRLPLVYVSLGSQNYHHPHIFRTAIEAARGRVVQLVVAAEDLANTDALGALPPNVILTGYAPQLALLERARAMITHGGANSVMEAMTAGVPLLVTPLINDQPHNAYFVQRSGAGLVLPLERTNPDVCWQAIAQLLEDGPERRATQRIADAYRSKDGAERTADRIVELAS